MAENVTALAGNVESLKGTVRDGNSAWIETFELIDDIASAHNRGVTNEVPALGMSVAELHRVVLGTCHLVLSANPSEDSSLLVWASSAFSSALHSAEEFERKTVSLRDQLRQFNRKDVSVQGINDDWEMNTSVGGWSVGAQLTPMIQ